MAVNRAVSSHHFLNSGHFGTDGPVGLAQLLAAGTQSLLARAVKATPAFRSGFPCVVPKLKPR